MRFSGIPNDEGHYDMEVVMLKEFSYRYKSYFGVEGTWNGDAKQFVLRIVLFGVTIGVTGGVSVGVDG